MTVKKRGLGRGLDALLAPKTPTVEDGDANLEQTEQIKGLTYLPLDWLAKGKFQPRRDMNPAQLDELANSIRQQGIMQPIVVRPIEDQKYEIIAGERRWRAARIAELEQVPVIVRHVEDSDAVVLALIENIQREDLNPIEEALALQRLIEEFHLTQQEVADTVGKSRSAVTNLLRLLGLSAEVRRLLEHGDIEMGHARALLPLEHSEQIQAASQVVTKSLSVRETEKLVRNLQSGNENENEKVELLDYSEQAEKISQKINAQVKIQQSPKGKGKVVIEYRNPEHLELLISELFEAK
ncbi:ParB/RepB/Spo0J family partition protein [Marinomonas mediterranea]|jgi:chromosome segregation DNA-binding protein|uniref:Probable chromosome-partitioning protein ParB n=1 Tax=Marinomonas mediterranea (strain ATCC 700492 / JCM 21426 / NBRC 103028 / MMB-1) TaxID=717774 RepID=F2K1T6_MARM1|nr:ParB/RepB/Spo0J family partition protein [Marinomonas mediterranea]ADZ93420.1 parB-like partition protein [Marinomonas mediterranea MMB-1]WCN11307.1 ParB/RepB/Spo0J family partition protein [Marinomonas mediterranea]WCN15372.1 ParB/RepB/Spo0J family partition protein [Marinomonas mediterranea]WCN19412.1 ParB/RepB/Spo0J family partition protein [Marinomonas mediterranea MMB-1]